MTAFGVIAIFIYKGLTRNPEIGKTHIWNLVKSEIWGELGRPNVARIYLIEYYWMLQNIRVAAFTIS